MKNILLVGGCGYIGTKLYKALTDIGHKVDIVDLLWFGNYTGTTIGSKNGFNLKSGDVSKYDTVVFLAGLSNDPMAEFSPGANFKFNTAAPIYLSYISKIAGVKKFVYASSCSIYGNTKGNVVNEEFEISCDYPYGMSKYYGEVGVLNMADPSYDVVCLRKGTVNGISPRMRFDLLLNTMVKNAYLNKKITVTNKDINRPVLGINDAIKAYVAAVDSKNISGSFNIISENCNILTAAECVRDTLKSTLNMDVEIEIQNIFDKRNYVVSGEAAKAKLDYTPSETVQSIVNDLVKDISTFGDLTDKKYYNIQIFKDLGIN